LEIWNHIAEDSFDNADRVIARLFDEFVRLAQAPGIGQHRLDLADKDYRFWVVSPYVIAYLWYSQPLAIAAVVHGARHLSSFFETRIDRSL
jgi:plasmid stabilization system protein ParE